jgi:hypothetical protein
MDDGRQGSKAGGGSVEHGGAAGATPARKWGGGGRRVPTRVWHSLQLVGERVTRRPSEGAGSGVADDERCRAASEHLKRRRGPQALRPVGANGRSERAEVRGRARRGLRDRLEARGQWDPFASLKVWVGRNRDEGKIYATWN